MPQLRPQRPAHALAGAGRLQRHLGRDERGARGRCAGGGACNRSACACVSAICPQAFALLTGG